VFSAGDATTNFPLVLIQPTGATASTTWSTGGTVFGINGDSTSNRLFDVKVDGTTIFGVEGSGVITLSQGVFQTTASTDTANLSSVATLSWNNDTILKRKDVATLQMGANAAGVTNQTLTAANRITSDGVGADLTIIPGSGLGGAGGTLRLATFTTGASGNPGVATNRFTIDAATGYTTVLNGFGGAVQALSGAGAVNTTTLTTALTSTGVGQALTLADGTNGQIKTLIHDVDGGSMVLTPTTKTGYTTITFTNVGETATLQFVTTRGWMILALRGAVAA
jgi:hypothetical protein